MFPRAEIAEILRAEIDLLLCCNVPLRVGYAEPLGHNGSSLL